MGNDIFQADYEKLDVVAERFGREAEASSELTGRIRRCVQSLRSGGWMGVAASAFFAEMNGEVFPALLRLTNALEGARTSTRHILALIRDAEEEAAEPFRGAYVPGESVRPPSGQDQVTGDATVPSGQGPGRPAGVRTPVVQIPPREFALMSEAAYEEGEALPAELDNAGWRVYMAVDGSDGYHGIAYINEGSNRVVFAHRGTNPDASIISDLDDDFQLWRGEPPGQFATSRNFVENVSRELAASGRGDMPVIHTGHSLGAVLADLNAAQDETRSITFENPGSREILENMGNRHDPNDFVAYQSSPNLINQTNRPAGHAFRVNTGVERSAAGIIDVAFGPAGTLAREANYQLQSHSMENMLRAMDPETGFPAEYRRLR